MWDLKYHAIALMQLPSPVDPTHTLGPGSHYLGPAALPRATRSSRPARANRPTRGR